MATPKQRRRSSCVRIEVEAALTSRVRTNPARRASMAGLLGERPLTLYLSPKSAPCRTAWLMLLKYKIPHDVVNVDEGGREVWRLLEAISPFGMIPAIKDGQNQLYGFPTCLQYISEEYCSGDGLGEPGKERAHCEAILNWASNTLYRDVVMNLVNEQLAVEENVAVDPELSMNRVAHARVQVEQHLKTLEVEYINKGPFLLGNKPLVADLHVAMTVSMLEMVSYPLGRHAKVVNWLKKVRNHYGELWDMVCESHNIRLMQRGSRRASVVA